MIFVNFKTYKEGSGQAALALVRILEEVAHAAQVKIIPVVQAIDLKEIAATTTLEVWVQKIDAATYGAHTGAILPEGVVEDGARGTFLNHSENKLTLEGIRQTITRAKEANLQTLVFAASPEELKAIGSQHPTYLAYEPPELVGSTTTSVTQAKPEIVSQAAQIARETGIPLIVGAGIHSRADVKKSLELGAVGVAVATDIVKALDPKKELLELVEGFK